MAGLKKVELFYDVVSPYSYFAFKVLTRYEQANRISLSLRPFFLGGIMNKSGNSPPLSIPNKAKYMLKDLKRCSDYFKIPATLPSTFPANTLTAQRLLTALPDKYKSVVTDKLFETIFQENKDISNNDVLKEILRKNSDLSDSQIESLFAQLSSAEVKDKLKDTTEEALSRGAFGAPTIYVNINGEDQLIFGSDRFHILFPLIGQTWDGPFPSKSKL